MARKLRIQYEGAVYHVMNRGDRREPVFKDDQDRKTFLETLGQCCARTRWEVHALCLMPTHFHLVVETPQKVSVNGIAIFRLEAQDAAWLASYEWNIRMRFINS